MNFEFIIPKEMIVAKKRLAFAFYLFLTFNRVQFGLTNSQCLFACLCVWDGFIDTFNVTSKSQKWLAIRAINFNFFHPIKFFALFPVYLSILKLVLIFFSLIQQVTRSYIPSMVDNLLFLVWNLTLPDKFGLIKDLNVKPGACDKSFEKSPTTSKSSFLSHN